MMRVRLGINTCFAVKRWPRPVDWLPIVHERLHLRTVQHTFDLVGDQAPDSEAVSIAAQVRGAGLDLHSTFTGLAAYSSNLLLAPDQSARTAACSWYEWAIKFSAEAGAIATGGHIGAYSVADWLAPEDRALRWTMLRSTLADLAVAGQRAGLEYLLVENLASAREPSTMDMLKDLLDDGDRERIPIRLCLDVGHMCVDGTKGADRDPYAWLRKFGKAAPVVQLQQSDSDGDHHWPFTKRWNELGRIDGARLIDALGEADVDDVVLVLEVIPPSEQDDDSVLADLSESVAYWREAFVRSGVTEG